MLYLKFLKLCGCGNDFNETSNLGLVVEGHAEQLDSRVVDVVVGGDHALQNKHLIVLLKAVREMSTWYVLISIHGISVSG